MEKAETDSVSKLNSNIQEKDSGLKPLKQWPIKADSHELTQWRTKELSSETPYELELRRGYYSHCFLGSESLNLSINQNLAATIPHYAIAWQK